MITFISTMVLELAVPGGQLDNVVCDPPTLGTWDADAQTFTIGDPEQTGKVVLTGIDSEGREFETTVSGETAVKGMLFSTGPVQFLTGGVPS